MNTARQQRGFTLMELLIVISIIGILISISAVSYISAQMTARDTRRINDIKAMQSAWEQYYADHASNYPATCGEDMSSYLPGGYPVDPRTNASYVSMYSGWSSCSAISYCFCAGLENGKYVNKAADCGGAAAPGTYKGLYCVQNLQ